MALLLSALYNYLQKEELCFCRVGTEDEEVVQILKPFEETQIIYDPVWRFSAGDDLQNRTKWYRYVNIIDWKGKLLLFVDVNSSDSKAVIYNKCLTVFNKLSSIRERPIFQETFNRLTDTLSNAITQYQDTMTELTMNEKKEEEREKAPDYFEYDVDEDDDFILSDDIDLAFRRKERRQIKEIVEEDHQRVVKQYEFEYELLQFFQSHNKFPSSLKEQSRCFYITKQLNRAKTLVDKLTIEDLKKRCIFCCKGDIKLGRDKGGSKLIGFETGCDVYLSFFIII